MITVILFWALWTVGIILVWHGVEQHSCSTNEEKAMDSLITIIAGLMFNAVACLINEYYILFLFSIGIAYWDYTIYKKKKEGVKGENLINRENFLKEINKFKRNNK